MNERERIELLMKCYNLTPSQFADRTGIQRASVSHIISGRNKPSLEVMQKIFEAFPELDIKWLMTGQGDEPVMGASVEAPEVKPVENTLFTQPQPPMQNTQPAIMRTQVANEPQPVRQSKPQSATLRQQAERPARRTQSQRIQAVHTDEKRIKEIRVYYTDGTYEILFPER
ncbi:MAG: helix-turn-helix transcriptional regulator [Bacteroidaceae bacterium]|nr:helix-turn-helix transcriptional regulator [Bacteroidaceae bacterium]